MGSFGPLPSNRRKLNSSAVGFLIRLIDSLAAIPAARQSDSRQFFSPS